jgi:bacteriorhodopsin
MAEIHVQAKKGSSSAWLWILITIIIIAALVFVLVWNNRDNIQKNANSKSGQTSFVQYQARRAA